ncbi:hypothetical protein [Agrobacterium tumefaciens]|uniref:hypothetical protein n=1 Tax=Agrobacterium tumefaciens TaxID=358 RepID=UPI003B9DC828
MSAIDRIGSTASLYIRPRPQDVSQAVPDPTPERSASLIGGGAAPSLSSNLANALWSLRGQEGGVEETPLEGGGTGSDEDELSRWANMSLGEKIRAQYLEARDCPKATLPPCRPTKERQ